MKKYFYSNGKEKKGPLSFDEIKAEPINPNTLIWHQGLDDWTEAKKVQEFLDYFETTPPPIKIDSTKKENINSRNQRTKARTKTNSFFSSPLSFEGRIRRTEYCISWIIYFFLAIFINLMLETGDASYIFLLYIPLLWFLWAQGAKRCHDLGNSGWYQIIPFYVLWMFFSKGEIENNKYGLNTYA